jgi:hypothetical protein
VTCECTTTLCGAHADSFKEILGDIPDRLATMPVTISKQSVTGGQGGKPTNDDDRPLPVNLGAAEATQNLRAELVNLINRVIHCLGEQPHDRTIPGVTMWAIKLMPRIVQHPESVDWYQGIYKAYERTTKAIDAPPERVRAGTCCGITIYASEDRTTVTCKQCRTVHDVAEMQAAELNRIRSYAGTASEVLRALSHAEVKIRLTRLTKWADRGQISYTTDDRGRVFIVGDVLDTLAKMDKQPA